MGQYWRIMNFDKKCALHNGAGIKLYPFLCGSYCEQLVGLLRTPQRLEFAFPAHVVRAAKEKSIHSPLLSLPQEIIDLIVLIYIESSSAAEVVNLSLTCGYLFRLTAPVLWPLNSGAWAGDRLIFVGDYADGYPPDIAEAGEKQDWDLIKNPLYNLGGEEAPYADVVEQAEATLAGEKSNRDDDLQLCRRMFRVPQPAPSHDPALRRAVLRNLTLKQYIRDDALAESDTSLSLAAALMTFMTWTDDGSGLDGLQYHGQWAGHRFDIAAMSSVLGAEWQDVSDVAMEQLITVTEGEEIDGLRAQPFD